MTAETVAGQLAEAAVNRGDRPLLRDSDGTTLTIADVAALTTAATRWLGDAGIRPGMTVAWQLPSHSSAAVLMLALARAPVTQAPVLHLYRRREVQAALDVAGADVLIVDGSTEGEAPTDIPVVRLPDDFLDLLKAAPTVPHPLLDARSSAGQNRWIYFTSGTTGRPKGVRHTDGTLLAAARGYTTHLGLGDHPDEVGTIAFPVAHIGGIIYLACALIADFPVLMVRRIDMHEFPRLLTDHRVTVTGASTAFYQMLLSAHLADEPPRRPMFPSLRMLIGGGAACPPELHHKVRRHLGVPILHAYGMTEAPMVCASEATDTEEQQSNSCGRPIPGAKIRIAPTGEIELRGANVTPGYTDAGQWARATTEDGWFCTGDRGCLRPDGRIVVTGRVKDLIIRKGENIAPDEVENELLAHPLIDEVAVLGQPDEIRGEMVCAVVRRSASHRDVTLDELCTFLDHRGLMKQKWPERLVIVDEFPLTGLGKVAKKDLAEQISGGAR
ncbi:MAG: AMP-binding protein [Mycobacterium sp.]